MTSRDLAREGDLLFYRADPSSLKDKFIGFLSKLAGKGDGKYVHVSMIDSTLNFQYEASLPRIRRSAVDWKYPYLELWRIKDVNNFQLEGMLEAAHADLGQWYGLGESLHALFKKGHLTICTQYVIDSAASGGYIDLTEDKGDLLVSPDEFVAYKAIGRIS